MTESDRKDSHPPANRIFVGVAGFVCLFTVFPFALLFAFPQTSNDEYPSLGGLIVAVAIGASAASAVGHGFCPYCTCHESPNSRLIQECIRALATFTACTAICISWVRVSISCSKCLEYVHLSDLYWKIEFERAVNWPLERPESFRDLLVRSCVLSAPLTVLTISIGGKFWRQLAWMLGALGMCIILGVIFVIAARQLRGFSVVRSFNFLPDNSLIAVLLRKPLVRLDDCRPVLFLIMKGLCFIFLLMSPLLSELKSAHRWSFSISCLSFWGIMSVSTLLGFIVGWPRSAFLFGLVIAALVTALRLLWAFEKSGDKNPQ